MARAIAKQKKTGAGRAKTALVTGASRGIGAELARRFARGGYDVILVARNERQLRTLAQEIRRETGSQAVVMAADLGEPGAPAALFQRVGKLAVEVDVLVNNVGLLSHGDFADIPLQDYERLIHLNIWVLTALTHLFLGPMRERGSGRILNVASLSAFSPVPQLGVYAASKAYVVSLSEALHEEFKGTGVTVTALCPGFVSTDMVGDSELDLPDAVLISPERVAREGYTACLKGVAVHVPGLATRLGARITDLQPRTVRRVAMGMISRLMLKRHR